MAKSHLCLLGRAALGLGETWIPLERKVAGVLAYLALVGPTSRSKLAGLLWPETYERAARNNLVQFLRRLRGAAAGYEAVRGEGTLHLAEGLEADVSQLVRFALQGRYALVVELEGELLRGYDYDDCPDFADWVEVAREHLSGLWREALENEASRLEEEGELRKALALAEGLEGVPRALAQVVVAALRLGEPVAQALLERISLEALGPADRRPLEEAGLALGLELP